MKRIEDVIDPALLGELSEETVLGVDIGSRNAKAVLLHRGQFHTALVATGVNMQTTAEELLQELLEESGLAPADIAYAVGTGYGRVAFKLEGVPSEVVTEISCHAMGAHFLNANTRTIIDIGGQDAKGIQIDPASGKVIKFRMNDKCAAGTGRFLEKAASLLGLTMREVGPVALQSTRQLDISSQCVVFAESEVVSCRARGEAVADIAAGVHFASARRVISLLNQIPLEADLVFTGGVSNNVGMRHALESLLDQRIVTTRLDMVYAGALGAAIHAQHQAANARVITQSVIQGERLDLSALRRRIDDAELSLIERQDVKKVGYMCTYTPVEVLNAAGVAYTRLAKCGEPAVVVQGEALTKSVFCDVTKSLLGQFAAKEPLHDSLDRVVTFYTCDSMRAASDAIDNYFKPSYGYMVPRGSLKDSARAMFRQQILHFKGDLETLTGKPISDDDVRQQISLFKEIRNLIKRLSDLRKRRRPPLSGSDFLDITRAHRTLPASEQLEVFSDLYARLAAQPDGESRRLRVMISGGMIADGDRRIMHMLERELGVDVVVEDHCTGIAPYYYPMQDSGDPWTDLASGYLDQAPCARQAPLQRRVDFSAHLAEEYAVDAVIFTYMKFCPCYGMTKLNFIKRFQSMGLPVLELDVDYSQNDSGQIKTRIEAFLEVAADSQLELTK
ncbi:MAG TPA: 2-hydroxyacyl-CoA dehydratase [Rhodocyclaceae bacterium]|nr:2-hydroxyacyl-CoA dehydratase [Rhodocyclaceae bacterium]